MSAESCASGGVSSSKAACLGSTTVAITLTFVTGAPGHIGGHAEVRCGKMRSPSGRDRAGATILTVS